MPQGAPNFATWVLPDDKCEKCGRSGTEHAIMEGVRSLLKTLTREIRAAIQTQEARRSLAESTFIKWQRVEHENDQIIMIRKLQEQNAALLQELEALRTPARERRTAARLMGAPRHAGDGATDPATREYLRQMTGETDGKSG